MLSLRCAAGTALSVILLIEAVNGLHVPTASAPTLAQSVLKASARRAEPSLLRTSAAQRKGEVASQQPLRLKGGDGALVSYMFALFKAIVGSGILSLSSGIAAFSNDKKMIWPAVAVSGVFGFLSAYCYALIGQVCELTGARTFQDCWAKSIGESTAWIPGLACTLQTAVACTCYSIIIGDLGRDLTKAFGVQGFFANREKLLMTVAALVLLPLCLLRSFAMLAYTSMLGVAGVLYVAVFMTLRWFQGEYTPSGTMYKQLPASGLPSYGTSFQPVKTLILMAMLNTAYHAHYDAPRFFHQIQPPSMSKFNTLVYTSFAAAAVICSLIMVVGFLTFGGNASSLILNSYASKDLLAILGRLGCGASITFSYPLVFNGFRTGTFALFGHKPSTLQNDLFAVGTVAATTSIAMVMNDLGFMVSFAGALLGSSIIYVFPAMMHIAASKTKGSELGTAYYASHGIAGLGVVLGLVGALVSYLKSFTNVLN